ncbi:ABC transporter ATP-binding protein [Lactobacillus sp. LL6]|uniref:ABC transporter ATP-binding protein n=1 Tax=Lactobacillus sp. LL6 TaxID=2596827 RepID=UPI0011848D0C|nr:ABC transporter ATP-binding protein [Lactobacillus sp. LL6]TSO25348.1 ABC transporter ATP-binding protein [Lactobacillus sp. LL6]
MSDNAVQMKHIVKEFNGFKANNDINLELKKGEILALLGENGAGKSTLMNILSGVLIPTSGEIKINDTIIKFKSAADAKENGIGMVYQHFMLEKSFTVLENIILGHEPTKGIFLNLKKAKQKVLALSKQYGLSVDLNSKVEDITIAQQQKVEILKVLYRGANILIFDEPTAVLTPQEITEFIKILKGLSKEGRSIILITHKLEEIKAVANRVTIIRSGKSVGTFNVAQVSDAKMAELMVGRHVNMKLEKKKSQLGNEVLSVKDLKVKENRGNLAIKDLSFEVKSGEILGIAGIDGNGQDELVEAITGLRQVSSGKIKIQNQDITNQKVRKITEAGVATIPADRQKYGLVLQMSLVKNLVLQNYYHPPYSRHKIINFKNMNLHAKKLINMFDIRAANEDMAAGELSGGNQQKIIIARELNKNSNLIIAFQPTRGLDVGAIEYIHKQLLKARAAGKAILLISYELDEIMQLSDRILVLHNGQKSGEVTPQSTNETELGLLMTGIK